MKKSPVRFVGVICAAGLIGGAVGIDATALQAGTTTDTATVSVTIAAAAKVGLVTLPVTAPAKTGGIPGIPISTTSNVGYGSPAPATSASGAGTVGATVSTGTSATPQQAARAFAARGAAPISIGPSAAVAVAGAPNQTFNVILPGKTSFASGGNVVSLSGFQHSAGTTPALGSDGSGTFSIGAAVDTAPAGDSGVAAGIAANSAAQDQEAGGSGADTAAGQQTVLAAAFTQRSPFVNIVITYN